MSKIKTWFEKNRSNLTGNWFLGKEPGTMEPDSFETSNFKVLIVRLSTYQDVASGITHLYLHQMASLVKNCFVDMAFLPPEQDERLMLKSQIPLLFGTTSKKAAKEFDLIAISNSVLQELINLPALLKHSNIPLTFQGRERVGAPMVLMGGSNSYNHSILHGAIKEEGMPGEGLVDCVLVGDAEGQFQKIIKTLAKLKVEQSRRDREGVVEVLRNSIEGLYDPRAYEQSFLSGKLLEIKAKAGAKMPLKANKLACVEGYETFEGGPVLYDGSGTSHVMVTAGCPFFCSFCKESWEQKPYREIGLERVLDTAFKLKQNLGLEELNLMTFNANTYSHIFEAINKLGSFIGRVGVKSQRFDAIVKAPELLDLQFDAGKRSYTCAMEGISERCRVLLQKNLSEGAILKGIALLLERHLRQLKVFMILTGYENEEDVEEYKGFLHRVKSLLPEGKRVPKITFSFAVLFRAPQTPMQYAERRMGAGQLRDFLGKIVQITRGVGFEARISAGVENALVSEFIAFADRRYTEILVEASVDRGFRYRGKIGRRLLEFWQKGMAARGLEGPDDWERSLDSILPWDDIDVGVKKEYLYNLWQRLKKGVELESCIQEPWGGGSCVGCGACDFNENFGEKYKKALAKLGPRAGAKIENSALQDELILWAEINVPKKWAFVSRDFIKTAVARRIMLDDEKLVKGFLRVELVEPSFFSWGRGLVKIAFKEKFVSLKPVDHGEKDVSILRRVREPKNKGLEGYPVRTLINMTGEKVAVLRHVDELLSEYNIKNFKKRCGATMRWEISEGHGNKTGIDLILYEEDSNDLILELNKMPDISLLNKITLNRAVRVL